MFLAYCTVFLAYILRPLVDWRPEVGRTDRLGRGPRAMNDTHDMPTFNPGYADPTAPPCLYLCKLTPGAVVGVITSHGFAGDAAAEIGYDPIIDQYVLRGPPDATRGVCFLLFEVRLAQLSERGS